MTMTSSPFHITNILHLANLILPAVYVLAFAPPRLRDTCHMIVVRVDRRPLTPVLFPRSNLCSRTRGWDRNLVNPIRYLHPYPFPIWLKNLEAVGYPQSTHSLPRRKVAKGTASERGLKWTARMLGPTLVMRLVVESVSPGVNTWNGMFAASTLMKNVSVVSSMWDSFILSARRSA